MLFREDGIWVTSDERLQLLRVTSFGVGAIDAYKRRIFEVLLPTALEIAETINAGSYGPRRLGDYVDEHDPTRDPMDIAVDLAEAELRDQGIDLWGINITPVEDNQPPTTDNRHRIPLELASSLAVLSSVDHDMELHDGRQPDILEIARNKALQALAIIPPKARAELISSELGKAANLDKIA